MRTMAVGFLALFIFTLPAFAEKPSECEASLSNSVAISSALVTVVSALEAEYREDLDGIELYAQRVAALHQSIDQLKTQMTWSERNLWRRLGVTSEKILELQTLEQQLHFAQQSLDMDKRLSLASDRAVLAAIERWLRTNQKNWTELRQLELHLNQTLCSGNICLSKVQKLAEDLRFCANQTDVILHASREGRKYFSNMRRTCASTSLAALKPEMIRYTQLLEKIQSAEDVFHFAFDFNLPWQGIFEAEKLVEIANLAPELAVRIEVIQRYLEKQNRQLVEILNQTVCLTRQACAEASKVNAPKD